MNQHARRQWLHHYTEAQALYERYKEAFAKVDQWEQAVARKYPGNPGAAAQFLSNPNAPTYWAYRALTGSLSGIISQLQIEVNMARLHRAAMGD